MPDTPGPKPAPRRARRGRSGSLFGPLLLIAVGGVFLLNNLGLLPALNWYALARLWPLLLVFLGLNILVRQARGRTGAALSGLVALAALAVFGGVLLFGDRLPGLGASPPAARVVIDEVAQARAGAATADITLDLGAAGADLHALAGGDDLISGEISRFEGDNLVFTAASDGEHADVRLDVVASGRTPFFWANPANWVERRELNRWRIGLSPAAALALRVDLGSGPVDLALDGLRLSELDVDGGSGPADLALPPGAYKTVYDAGSGPVTIRLPASGDLVVELDGGSGPVTIFLPFELPARFEVNTGSGPFVPDDRLTAVDVDEDRDGVWQTDDYDDAASRVLVIVDGGSGPIRVAGPETGR